jgi:hypothetical protein
MRKTGKHHPDFHHYTKKVRARIQLVKKQNWMDDWRNKRVDGVEGWGHRGGEALTDLNQLLCASETASAC